MKPLILLLCVMLFVVPAASATTYVVEPDGSGDFPTIEAAMAAVVDGDIIELADGTFRGNGNRDILFYKAVTVRSQSGNPEVCIVDCEGSYSHPHYGFRFASGMGSESVLEGITITNGNEDSGAGVTCWGTASSTLVNCVFSSNLASFGGGAAWLGGGSPTFTDCTFSGNVADEWGGGMYCAHEASPTFIRCTFSENLAEEGGGMHCEGFATSLSECTFVGNTSTGSGAGIYCGDPSPALTNCTFSGNVSGSVGGGMYCNGSSPILTYCAFLGNRAHLNGGGILCAGSWSYPTLVCCTFSRNVSQVFGGAIANGALSLALSHCTLVWNSSQFGGGIYCSSGTQLNMENTIISFGTAGEAVHCQDPGDVPTLICCDIYANAGGDWVGCIEDQCGIEGNISEDPMFCDPGNEDFSLHCASPCAPFSPPNEECDLIGAWPVGCGGTLAVPSSWGGIKALFRR